MMIKSLRKDEMKKGIKNDKKNNVMDDEEIPEEIIKIINDDNLDMLHELFNKIYDAGIYPDNLLKPPCITISKKNNGRRMSGW